MSEKYINKVIEAYKRFLSEYKLFRSKTSLKDKRVNNVHEFLTAMTDKHGRICRFIKHQERNDPKENWKEEMSQSLTGYIAYAILLMEHYDITIDSGMKKELEEAIKQHG